MSMKRITMIVAALAMGIMATTAACVTMYDGDRLIGFNELPEAAKKFITAHFADKKISHIIYDSDIDDRDYKVDFEDGTEIKFDSDGDWRKVDCHHKAIPAKIIPSKIASYVERNFAGEQIEEISRKWNEWEVELSNGIELEFDNRFKLRKIDD